MVVGQPGDGCPHLPDPLGRLQRSAGVVRGAAVGAEAVGAAIGSGAAKLIAAAILVSIFSATNCLLQDAPFSRNSPAKSIAV